MNNSANKMISKKEVRYIDLIKKNILNNENILLFDVGSNKGYYSEFLNNEFKNAKIYSFEPVPRFFGIMKINLSINDNITLINKACSNNNESKEFYEIISPDNESAEGLSSLNYRDVYKKFKHQKINIESIRLDDFIKENKIDKINFMKIDTEGHELSILEGAIDSLQKGVFDYIQIEYGDCIKEIGKDLDDILNLIKNTDYKIYDYKENGFVEINLQNYKDYKNVSWDNYLITKIKL